MNNEIDVRLSNIISNPSLIVQDDLIINFDDMTLAQVKDAKSRLCESVRLAIADCIDRFYRQYDCGAVGISVETDEIPPIETVCGQIIVPKRYEYIVNVTFSKEYDEHTQD